MHETTYSYSFILSPQNTHSRIYKYILRYNLLIKHTIKLHIIAIKYKL